MKWEIKRLDALETNQSSFILIELFGWKTSWHQVLAGELIVSGLAEAAVQSALQGDLLQARERFLQLLAEQDVPSPSLINQLAAVEAALGDAAGAIRRLQFICNGEQFSKAVSAKEAAFSVEGEHCTSGLPCRAAEANLAFLRKSTASQHSSSLGRDHHESPRIAIVSLLFNWPSTEGGTVHTKELVEQLSRAGYLTRHLYAAHAPWGIGQVREPLPYDAQHIEFQEEQWKERAIRHRFRQELIRFNPDWMIVTDSWNSKVLLAEAAAGFRTLIRIAAQECLCPLNNVRLLVDAQGTPGQCALHQLQSATDCRRCVARHGSRLSGPLHQAERELVGFGTPDYDRRLRQMFANAAGVLAINPLIAGEFRPFARQVHVVPSGFDAQRFEQLPLLPSLEGRKVRFLFAGLLPEFMKGFHVLKAAAERLWQLRQDFEVWATGEPEGTEPPWLKCVGWQSQPDLPALISACDVLIFPTIAQEGLGRTAVEAIGCGRLVIASRIGGLSWVVEEGVTGLLCSPGEATELAACMARLLEDVPLHEQLGAAGRKKFLKEFTWDVVLERHYRSLLEEPARVTLRC